MRHGYHIAPYPNLELLEFKSLLKLNKTYPIYSLKNVQAQMFLQLWGSTALGFDKDDKGNSCLGGQAMTEAYTTVFEIEAEVKQEETRMVEKFNITEKEETPEEKTVREIKTERFFVVAFGNEPCYLVENPTDTFFTDLAEHNMKPLSQAEGAY